MQAYLAHADTERTCSYCAALDGTEVGMEEDFIFTHGRQTTSVTTPPAHPHCMCTISYEELTPPIQQNEQNAGFTNEENYDIINIKDKSSQTTIHSPIERNSSIGNPNAILHFNAKLNNRQKRILEQLPTFNSKVYVAKKDVNMSDLAAFTAKTGDEFSMFTKGNLRLIVRGNTVRVNIDIQEADKLVSEGYRWSGHTHPGVDFLCMQPSDGDYKILSRFKQSRTVIYNSKGNYRIVDKKAGVEHD